MGIGADWDILKKGVIAAEDKPRLCLWPNALTVPYSDKTEYNHKDIAMRYRSSII